MSRHDRSTYEVQVALKLSFRFSLNIITVLEGLEVEKEIESFYTLLV
jgi:hypothetical protein